MKFGDIRLFIMTNGERCQQMAPQYTTEIECESHLVKVIIFCSTFCQYFKQLAVIYDISVRVFYRKQKNKYNKAGELR